MRILFDGYWWMNGPAANRSVQREIIRAWSRVFPEDELVVALRQDAAPDDLPPGTEAVRTRLWPHAAANIVELPRLARRARADAVIAHNFTPWSGPTATFVHDVMFAEHPEWFSRSERMYFAAMLPTARRARLVVTSSETEAHRIRRRLARSAPSVVAVGLGAPTSIVGAEPRRPDVAAGLDGFALTVGRLNARKNLSAVIDAAAASSRITPQTPLVVVGSSEHSGVAAELPPDIDALRMEGRVRFAGRLTDEELSWMYRNCAVNISLSRDEGFGLTPIEAVASGAPLLVSDIPVHRETVGDVARFVPLDVPPTEVAAMIDLTWGSRTDPVLRNDVLNRCEWGAVARRYREAVESLTPATR